MKYIYRCLIALVVVIALVLSFINIIVLNRHDQSEDIDRRIDSIIKRIDALPTPLNGVDGYTPVKGIDYFDGYTPVKGVDYRDGVDSKSTHTKETVIKQVPINGKDGVDGLTPELRCSVTKNRWELRYSPEASWQIAGGIPSKCTVTKEDILEVLESLNES